MVDGVIEDVVDLDLDPDLGAGVGSNFNLLLGGFSRAPKVFLPNFNFSLRLNLLLSVFALRDLLSELVFWVFFTPGLDFGGDLMI